jgi:uncharacterized protein YdeI (YjbR/CyaY-like superfamily)
MGNRLCFKDRREFRNWLEKNHSKVERIWIEYFKDGTPGINYQESLEEALCFGWIDSIIKKIDQRIYVRKFTPRRSRSKWSEINKGLVNKLIRNGKMTKHGLAKAKEAKRNGSWKNSGEVGVGIFDSEETSLMLTELRKIISSQNKKRMLELFDRKGEKARMLFVRYYFSAKNEETRRRRLKRIFEVLKG